MKKVLPIVCLLLGLWSKNCLAQTKCDTILTTDGRVIACKIVEMGRLGILYGACGTREQRKFHLPAAIIKDIKSPRSTIRQTKGIVINDKNYVPHLRKDTLTHSAKADRTHWSLCVGMEAPWIFAGEDNGMSAGFFQFGLEITARNSPQISTAIFLVPLWNGDSNGEGVNAELGLMVKKFGFSAYTGVRNKFYWGAEARIGRIGSTKFNSSNGATIHRTDRWDRLMACMGFQFGKRGLYLDISLSGGYTHYRKKVDDLNVSYNSANRGLVLQPAASAGIRF